MAGLNGFSSRLKPKSRNKKNRGDLQGRVGSDTKYRLIASLGEKRFSRLLPDKYYNAMLMDENSEYLADNL